jgi:signal transduction protein with GAF and PtsI domain
MSLALEHLITAPLLAVEAALLDRRRLPLVMASSPVVRHIQVLSWQSRAETLERRTLGVDRDSALLAHVFDEADPGVKKLIETVTRKVHAKGKKVGLCGQAPSDRPEFAVFLAGSALDSISVTPNAFANVVTRLRR